MEMLIQLLPESVSRRIYEGKCRKRERKLGRARELMESPRLSHAERKERDKIVKWLGKNGGLEGTDLLKCWAVCGSVWLRPNPEILGKAIARGEMDPNHVLLIANLASGVRKIYVKINGVEHMLEMPVPFYEQYYSARVLAAEGHGGAERLVRFIEKEKPDMAEAFEKARNAVKG